jgi:hypothetical protein
VAVLDTIVLVGLMLQNPSDVDGQGTSSTSAGPRDPSLDRIRARLAERPLITVPPSTPLFTTRPSDRPLFKVHIQGPGMPPWEWLDTGTTVPAYVRPTYTPTHHEFLLGVTPELFRGAAVHPYGVPVLSIGRAIANAIRGPLRRRKEANARREVEEALAALEASRRKPPGRSRSVGPGLHSARAPKR